MDLVIGPFARRLVSVDETQGVPGSFARHKTVHNNPGMVRTQTFFQAGGSRNKKLETQFLATRN